MAYEKKDNTGAIFKNDKKTTESHPDRKGDCLIDGKEYWVAGWLKDGKNGQFLSLAFTAKDAKPEKLDGKRAGSKDVHDQIDKEDIPF
jgi:hypothetical protein